jgi:RNA polymerase sigma-70 factor (ECF subfamily)
MVRGPTDEELVERFKRGDRSAFSALVTRHQDAMYTLCLRQLRNPTVAEEVSQDAFLSIFKGLHRFRGEARFKTWMFRVAVNHCKNRRLYRQRRATNRHESLDQPAGPDDDAPRRQLPSDATTDSRVHQQQAKRLLENAMARLDEEQRTIIVLRDLEDLSYEEISAILDLPRGTVKSRLHRARLQLTQTLSRDVRREDII